MDGRWWFLSGEKPRGIDFEHKTRMLTYKRRLSKERILEIPESGSDMF